MQGITQNLYALEMDGGRSKEAYDLIVGKVIDRIQKEGDTLVIESGGNVVTIHDDGQRCCEHRYMTCDDDLDQYAGAKLLSIEEREGASEYDEYGDLREHDTQFLKIVTDRGDITACTHNEHNGYYGGFSVVLRVVERSGNKGGDDE